MKQYPYNDSTDVIIYDRYGDLRNKKEKKSKTWLIALSSALAASVLTVGITKGVDMFTDDQHTTEIKSSAYYTNGNAGVEASDAAKTLATKSEGDELTIPEIAAKVGPSVVGIINKTTIQTPKLWDPFSGRYYYSPDANRDGETVEQGSGSGIIFNTDGYIVTNQHVIDGASEIEVILNTGTSYTAKLVGEDEKTDLAVIKIEPKSEEPLIAAVLGDSTTVEVGELAVAIGNPMGMEYSGSVTAGIISAVNRTMSIDNRTYNLLQTDAAINAGNSGGALINRFGEVIGINSVKLSTTGVEGMGFAIAISEAKPIINELMSSGYVTGRPLVGISISETRYGLFISSVQEGSGAEEAGLKENDMIIEVDGTKVSSTSEINEIRDKKKPGDTLKFKVMRDGETMEIDVKLIEDVSAKKQ
ncbi:MAG: trypsin-like peptidase domain-containing protein [Oscillospiraceae bacterium]|nr:trypsin-like peptidase domain-containing protein [Oscillospiraceae bacterium]